MLRTSNCLHRQRPHTTHPARLDTHSIILPHPPPQCLGNTFYVNGPQGMGLGTPTGAMWLVSCRVGTRTHSQRSSRLWGPQAGKGADPRKAGAAPTGDQGTASWGVEGERASRCLGGARVCGTKGRGHLSGFVIPTGMLLGAPESRLGGRSWSRGREGWREVGGMGSEGGGGGGKESREAG